MRGLYARPRVPHQRRGGGEPAGSPIKPSDTPMCSTSCDRPSTDTTGARVGQLISSPIKLRCGISLPEYEGWGGGPCFRPTVPTKGRGGGHWVRTPDPPPPISSTPWDRPSTATTGPRACCSMSRITWPWAAPTVGHTHGRMLPYTTFQVHFTSRGRNFERHKKINIFHSCIHSVDPSVMSVWQPVGPSLSWAVSVSCISALIHSFHSFIYSFLHLLPHTSIRPSIHPFTH